FRWQQLSVPETLTDIQRAARFFYLQKLTFGGKVEGQTFGSATTSGPRFNLMRIEEDLSDAHLRLAETLVEHLPWDDCVVRYDRPHSLFYCDPPYWETEGYGVAFAIEEYVRLAELARSIDGTMIISVNDHPRMREVFDGLEMRSVPITYTVGGADKAADRHELVIGNWRGGWPNPVRPQASLPFDLPPDPPAWSTVSS
ncbi:MAG: DNA adenine methylase, partial [Panacagrimonas sp.]